MKYEAMSRKYLLAAETYSYSYANYADHLGVNVRFDKYMPRDMDVLEGIVTRKGGPEEVADSLDIALDIAKNVLESYLTAKEIVIA